MTADPDPELLLPPAIEAPATVRVIVTCPACGERMTLPVRLSSRMVTGDDESSTLGVRARVAKGPHLCGQVALPLELVT